MSTMMQAARLTEPIFKYHIQTIPIPEPLPREILIKVHAAGYCHTDSVMPFSSFGGPLPITGSHEPAGIVVKLGQEAQLLGWKIGERIMAVNTARGCRECSLCIHHDERFCPKSAEIGLRGVDGAFAEYCLVDARYAVKIPDKMSFEQAAPMSCAGVTIYHSIMRCDLKPGQVLGINGIGALGSLGVQMAKALGLIVVAIDGRNEPLLHAKSQPLAPDLAVNAVTTSAGEALNAIDGLRPPGWTGGSGVDALIMATSAPSALPYALSILRPFSTIVMTAGPMDLVLSIGEFIFRGITMIGTKNGTAQDLEAAMKLCLKHGIESQVKTYAFGQEGMERLVKETHEPGWTGKAVVVMKDGGD
ncbi:alcohol dehydrogenase [Naematelia encephala]|uniref:Alcohol dehydrogenase n=1 Tax=Naematelia encephala TaxID=71784 RepID=A0A1Y2AU39_9TREE|nr:alcohol dehydrogenase [Naematelia encephala]